MGERDKSKSLISFKSIWKTSENKGKKKPLPTDASESVPFGKFNPLFQSPFECESNPYNPRKNSQEKSISKAIGRKKCEGERACVGIESKIRKFESLFKSSENNPLSCPPTTTSTLTIGKPVPAPLVTTTTISIDRSYHNKTVCSILKAEISSSNVREGPRRVSYSFGESRKRSEDYEVPQRRRGLSVQAGLLNIQNSLCSFVNYPCSAKSQSPTSTVDSSPIKSAPTSPKIDSTYKPWSRSKSTRATPTSKQNPISNSRSFRGFRHSSLKYSSPPFKPFEKTYRPNSCSNIDNNFSTEITQENLAKKENNVTYSSNTQDKTNSYLISNYPSRLFPPGELPSAGPLRRVFSTHTRRRKKSKGLSFQLTQFMKEPLRVVHSVPLSIPTG